MKHRKYLYWAISLMSILSPVENRAGEGWSMDSSLTYDGSKRWWGYGILNTEFWSFGAAGARFSTGEFKGMLGINSTILTLGHLSDAGLAAEVRNPEYDALSRLTEKTAFRADIRSFSSSRFGIVLSSWDKRVGVGWERRPGIDAGLIWAYPVETDLWEMELLWTGGVLDSEDPKDDWYPEESAHPGGAFTTYAMRNRFEKGHWTGTLTSIVSAGVHFRPGFLLAGAMGLSSGAWLTRMRGTWSTKFYRNAEGALLDIPVGIAWDGRYSPRTGPLLAARFHLPLHTYYRNSTTEDESCIIELGWRFTLLELRSYLEWDGLTREPVPKRLAGRIQLEKDKSSFEVKGTWDFIRDWSIRFKWVLEVGHVCIFNTGLEFHKETVLLVDSRISVSLLYTRGKFVLTCTLANIPRDWETGPKSAGDLILELRWFHRFYD